ncbi:hypothetical protein SPHINGO391_520107 [Sphingomonas aurantiaca]|uniref:Uncharacterized protein n=1 Tax=Sphingomonas aurantiaca TaxID=185949 RepID=A0A5E8AJ22_9SPHN|nr:hypothetical protein SPHINGO391_520107 [Sphingomonas aurantiaca]
MWWLDACRTNDRRRGLLRPPHAPQINDQDWLGRQGSNLRMAASKAAALPLGDAPTEAAL